MRRKKKKAVTENISTRYLEDPEPAKIDQVERHITADGRCSCGGYIHHFVSDDGERISQCGWCQYIF